MDGVFFNHDSVFEQKVNVHFRMQNFLDFFSLFFCRVLMGEVFIYQCPFYGLDFMALFYFILYLNSECNSPIVNVGLNKILFITFIF